MKKEEIIRSILDKQKELQEQLNQLIIQTTEEDEAVPEKSGLITHSFKMIADDLESLKDYQYTMRKRTGKNYTQTKALHDAIKLLITSTTIIPRTQDLKEEEKERSKLIIKGKKAKKKGADSTSYQYQLV